MTNEQRKPMPLKGMEKHVMSDKSGKKTSFTLEASRKDENEVDDTSIIFQTPLQSQNNNHDSPPLLLKPGRVVTTSSCNGNELASFLPLTRSLLQKPPKFEGIRCDGIVEEEKKDDELKSSLSSIGVSSISSDPLVALQFLLDGDDGPPSLQMSRGPSCTVDSSLGLLTPSFPDDYFERSTLDISDITSEVIEQLSFDCEPLMNTNTSLESTNEKVSNEATEDLRKKMKYSIFDSCYKPVAPATKRLSFNAQSA